MNPRLVTLMVSLGFLCGAITIAFAQETPTRKARTNLDAPLGVTQLPTPVGQFSIGRIGYDWVDSSRPDGHSSDLQAHRDLMVYLWYPSPKEKSESYGAYLPGAKQMDADATVRPVMQEEFGPNWPSIVSGAISSHATDNAPIAKSPKPFPVVILSHGLGGTSFEYTALIEDLVSRGYVVAAIENTYIAAAVVFPDGKVVPAYHAPENPNMTPDQRFQQMMKGAGQEINTGAQDVIFALNQLTALDTGNQQRFVLAKRLDLNRVVAMGHSAGGAGATLACQLDARFKACLDLDGAMPPIAAFPENPDGHWFTQPVLLLEIDHSGQQRGFNDAQNDEYLKKKEEQLSKCPSGTYDVTLKAAGLVHGSFSDYPLLSAHGQAVETELALRNLKLTESLIRAFLEKTLQNEQTPLLDDETKSPEATIMRYGHR